MAAAAPAPNIADAKAAEGDGLTEALRAVRAAERNGVENSEIAADDAGVTALAEQIGKTAPPPASDPRS